MLVTPWGPVMLAASFIAGRATMRVHDQRKLPYKLLDQKPEITALLAQLEAEEHLLVVYYQANDELHSAILGTRSAERRRQVTISQQSIAQLVTIADNNELWFCGQP